MNEHDIWWERTLIKPIESRKGEITVLECREPVAEDAAKAGGLPYNYRLDDDGNDLAIDINPRRCLKILSKISGVPTEYLGNMSAQDTSAACQKLMRFFMGISESTDTDQAKTIDHSET